MGHNYKYIKKELLSESRKVCEQNYLSNADLNISVYENADVFPKMGLVVDGKLHEPSLKYLTVGDVKQDFVTPDQICCEECVYVGRLITRWGHCITTDLMYFWYFLKKEIFSSLKDFPLVFVTDTDTTQLPATFIQLLSMIGVDITKLRHIKECTRFKRLYVPDPCYFFDEANGGQQRYTQEYTKIIDKICDQIPANNRFPKIYFTRTQLTQNHRDYGEEQIEKVFAKKGYTIIAPEKLPFKEQLSLLRGCQSFASTDGSSGHNSLFLNKGTECVFIRKVDLVNPYQALIDHMKQLKVTTIDANWSFLLYNNHEPWEGPFFVFNNKLLRKWSGVWTFFPVTSFYRYIMHYAPKWIRAKCQNMMNK